MRTAITIFAIGLSLLSFAQDEDHIYWSSERPVTWDDFQGPPNMGSPYVAETAWYWAYSMSSKADSLHLTLKCSFRISTSWYKKDRATDALLKHEQLHFDIAELNARRLRKALATENYKARTVQDRVTEIYKSWFAKCQEMQRLYDKETDHSRNKEKQKFWNEKIARMLEDTEKHSFDDISAGFQQ